jgi:hypothetical protein
MTIQAIETRYAGCRFRSRLEARWAVFFDSLGITWDYEIEGYELPSGKRYLPDFLLPDCGTWIEVKGHDGDLNRPLLLEAAQHLPFLHNGLGEQCGGLMILGPIPQPDPSGCDWGWTKLDAPHGPGDDWAAGHYVFGMYAKNLRPWWADIMGDQASHQWTTPVLCNEWLRDARAAYVAARSARFEHGETR